MRFPRGFHPKPPSAKIVDELPPLGVEAAVKESAFDARYGILPPQPDDKSRVWGANSYARLPAFGGKVTEAAPRQSGYRMPQSVNKEECAQLGCP